MEHTFTDANFETDVLKSPVPVVVDFWAPWCAPCLVMGPILEEIANEMDSAKIKIGKLNVDENGQTAMAYSVMSIPSFIVYKNGEVVEEIRGSMEKDALKERIAKHVA
ncbi:MAG: thioredoxin [Patescibacteria group bacterium]|jgi:thioredoxin 1